METAQKPTIKNKCHLCQKKINLVQATLGKCPCGNVFCADHRFSSDHGCEFDYKKKEREILAKQNPVIEIDKLRGGRV